MKSIEEVKALSVEDRKKYLYKILDDVTDIDKVKDFLINFETELREMKTENKFNREYASKQKELIDFINKDLTIEPIPLNLQYNLTEDITMISKDKIYVKSSDGDFVKNLYSLNNDMLVKIMTTLYKK